MRYLLIWSLLFLSVKTFAQDSTTINQDEQLVKQFISTLNSNSLETITRYVDSHFSPESLSRWQGSGRERYIGYTMNMALLHHTLSLKQVTRTERDQQIRLTGDVLSKNTALEYSLVIMLDDKSKISGWYIRPSGLGQFSTQSNSEEALLSTLEKLTDHLAKNEAFSGTVLLAKGDKVLFQKAHGFASRRYDVKNNIDTKFQIGSLNKMFTSVAIMQLVETEKLSVNDKLTQYLDRKYFGEGHFDNITVKQLLTHTSGLGAIPDTNNQQSKMRSLKDSLPLYKGIKLNFEPGSRWQYSSTGMRMLGHVIEVVSKQSYYDFIEQHVYKKAGMTNSGSFDLDVPIKNTARNYWYSTETKTLTENFMMQGVKGGPAGGGYSTVSDLHHFALALLNHQLLNSELTVEATSAKPQLHSPYYGYGFSVRGDVGNQVIGHNGSYLGTSAQLNIYRDKGYILAVLGNSDAAGEPIVFAVNELIQKL
ncbi:MULTISPECIES: serine hydrolase domain-containing protein [Pseudoalteromonas]|uniref:Oxidoreductase n=1 Tax=Pseudoalteromonas amylolytica TaxID=1859457 RepID=A0A1S1MYA9_9GAMM|nr:MULTISPECIES: serine hydrolase domain-containing protein [Pseudoalteromonas]OHU87712.1 oxidoreductase [Pseudoalteromonas sp. JW3]OHU91154.1 oxidoreductase [Pseudoalteromonas amylolytica]